MDEILPTPFSQNDLTKLELEDLEAVHDIIKEYRRKLGLLERFRTLTLSNEIDSKDMLVESNNDVFGILPSQMQKNVFNFSAPFDNDESGATL